MLGAEVVTHQRHGVAVDLQSAPLDFLGEECPHTVVHKAFVLYQIIDDGALACSQRACNAYSYHSV